MPNRPEVRPGTRPSPGADRPNLGTTRPGTTRPVPGTGRPDGITRPNLGGDRGPGRPSTLPAERPSRNDLHDFLNLPGNMPTRPSLTDRRPGNINVGDVNINAGNRVGVNREANVNAIRSKWNQATTLPFERNWWNTHYPTNPGWRWHGYWNRYPAYWCWRPATWVAYGTWFPWQWTTPYRYVYGTNVVYRDNYVYVNDQRVASSQEYYEQAEVLAENVPETVEEDKTEWMPLGVFALADESGADSGMVIQLAVSKEGLLAGTFYNDLSDTTRPLEGTVDPTTQRAAWKFADGKNEELVMETVVYNLTEDSSTALLHYGPEKTETWSLVRLPEPEGASTSQ